MKSTGLSRWNSYKNLDLIKDGVLEIGDGYRAKNSELDVTGLPFARAGNINNGFKFEDADLLCKNSVAKARDKISQVNDSVITTKGTFGRVAYVRSETETFVYAPQLCYWRVKDPSVIDPRFLFYWLQGPDFLSQAFQIKSSTDMADYASLGDQRKMSVTAPSPVIQKKIAAILSAYDELIENNQRRIVILETLAEEIYREWFVRMRFPGHDKVKMIKGVPEGWDVVKVKNVVDRKRFGKIYRESELCETGNVGVIDQSTKDHLGYYTGEPEHAASIDDPIILFGDHSCKMLLMIEPFSLAENVIPFKSQNNVPIVFLFFLMHNLIETTEYKRHWTELVNKSVYLPLPELQELYSSKVKDLLLHKHYLSRLSQSIQKSRDLLLPRLISGKLDVEKLDITFPRGMLSKEGAA